jgi:hypothetical protein
LKIIDEKIDRSNVEVEIEDLNKIKTEITANLEEIDRYRTEGFILRSRWQWHEKGEKNNKYFLGLCSRNKIKTSVNKLFKDDGTETTNQRDILGLQREFYKGLYTKKGNKK